MAFHGGRPRHGTAGFECVLDWQGPRVATLSLLEATSSCEIRAFAGSQPLSYTVWGEASNVLVHRGSLSVELGARPRTLAGLGPLEVPCERGLVVELSGLCLDGSRVDGVAACEIPEQYHCHAVPAGAG